VLTKTTEKESAFKIKYSNPTNQGKMVGVSEHRAQSRAEQSNKFNDPNNC